MTFIARPMGRTLKRFSEAIVRPHDSQERFDGDFPVLMRCELCGEAGMARRADISIAMKEHRESYCKARKTKQDDEHVMRIAYPWT